MNATERMGQVDHHSIMMLRLAVANQLHQLSWRWHGVGMLQAYLNEGVDQELRVHLWHPGLVREGMFDHGDIHNHRFRFVSTVLMGEIEHTEMTLREGSTYQVLSCVHARKDIGARYEVEPVPLVDLEQQLFLFTEGDRYIFERGAFHRTQVVEPTVTLVAKYDQIEDKALILARADEPAVHAFEPDDLMPPGVDSFLADMRVRLREF